jgi:hypothetical protein
MPRLERPLDRQSVRQADEQLYADHAGDRRPNALYDAQGNRQPLHPTDPAQTSLRREWVASYNESLASRPSAATAPQESTSSTERPVGGVTECCPNTHYIEIVVRPKVDEKKPRPGNWPPVASNPYVQEVYSAETTVGPREGNLDGSGGVRFDSIAAGSCAITLPKFFDEIAEYADRQLNEFVADPREAQTPEAPAAH